MTRAVANVRARVLVVDRSRPTLRAELREVYRAWKLQKRIQSPGARRHWVDALLVALGREVAGG